MSRPALLAWLGVLVPPFAWAAQHIAGFAAGLAECPDNTQGPGWHVPVHPLTLVVGGGSATLVLLGGLSAGLAWRATRGTEDDDAPPAGRIHFLAVIGMTIAPLFLVIVLLSSAGALAANGCVQS